jgi:hypothetical protein
MWQEVNVTFLAHCMRLRNFYHSGYILLNHKDISSPASITALIFQPVQPARKGCRCVKLSATRREGVITKMKSIGIFCGSSAGEHPLYSKPPVWSGRTLAQQGLALVYGGGKVGLMGRSPMRRWRPVAW